MPGDSKTVVIKLNEEGKNEIIELGWSWAISYCNAKEVHNLEDQYW